MSIDVESLVKELASIKELREALVNRPPYPFRKNEADANAVKRASVKSVVLGLPYFEDNTDRWAYYRMAACLMVKYTGLTYFDLCGVAPLPDYLIIEHLQINNWIDEAQSKRMRKR